MICPKGVWISLHDSQSVVCLGCTQEAGSSWYDDNVFFDQLLIVEWLMINHNSSGADFFKLYWKSSFHFVKSCILKNFWAEIESIIVGLQLSFSVWKEYKIFCNFYAKYCWEIFRMMLFAKILYASNSNIQLKSDETDQKPLYEAKCWFSSGHFTSLVYYHTSAHPKILDR